MSDIKAAFINDVTKKIAVFRPFRPLYVTQKLLSWTVFDIGKFVNVTLVSNPTPLNA